MSSDIYEEIKTLCGKFLLTVLQESGKRADVITYSVLELILEKYIGTEILDLENTEINITTFSNFVKEITRELKLDIKKEAILFLHNATEFYLLRVFSRAVEQAKNARRTRITVKDIELASRR